MTDQQTFTAFLEQHSENSILPDSATFIYAVKPVLETVLNWHHEGLVAPITNATGVLVLNNQLHLNPTLLPQKAKNNLSALKPISRYDSSAFDVVQEDVSNSTSPDKTALTNYLIGFQSDEQHEGHHDGLTDVFMLGQILVAYGFGLDLNDSDDFNRFKDNANQLIRLPNQLHPNIIRVLESMVHLNRLKRPQNITEVLERLEGYLEFDPNLAVDLTQQPGFKLVSFDNRQSWILQQLRSRLFDLTKRNRLLYFKPSGRYVNLTTASIPTQLPVNTIQPKSIVTYNSLEKQLKASKTIQLNKVLRFDDAPYLKNNLDRIRSEARKSSQEYGFDELKLVVGFLKWYNTKDAPEQQIVSPLLLIPAKLTKKRGLEDHYELKTLTAEAEVNPILVYYLKELFGIELPNFIDLKTTNLSSLFEVIQQQLQQSGTGVNLNLYEKPSLKIIQASANKLTQAYQRRRRSRKADVHFTQLEHSYRKEDFQPLGVAIFEKYCGQHQPNLEAIINQSNERSSNRFSVVHKDFYTIDERPNNPFEWEFDLCNITLGNFQYKKMTLVRDYDAILNEQLKDPIFDQLFSDEIKAEPPNIPVVDVTQTMQILPADPTQLKVLQWAQQTSSFIVQGPPGTGKSQTITNLISQAVWRGKRVLFVCEKRAALDVVYHRLKQCDLDEMCAIIHDSQTDKKSFIQDLKRNYEQQSIAQTELEDLKQELKQLSTNWKIIEQDLKKFHLGMQLVDERIGASAKTLLSILIKAEDHQNLPNIDDLPPWHVWDNHRESVANIQSAIAQLTNFNTLAEHPLSKVNPSLFQQEISANLLLELIEAYQQTVKPVLQNLPKNLPETCKTSFKALKVAFDRAAALYPIASHDLLALRDADSEVSQRFDERLKSIAKQRAELTAQIEQNKRWKNKLDKADAERALNICIQYENRFFRWLYRDFRNTKKVIQQAYQFDAHQIKPKYTDVLHQLIQEFKQMENLNDSEEAFEQDFPFSKAETAKDTIHDIRKHQLEAFQQLNLSESDWIAFIQAFEDWQNPFKKALNQLTQLLEKFWLKDADAVEVELNNIRQFASDVPILLPTFRQVENLPAPIKSLLKKHSVSTDEFNQMFAQHSLQELYRFNKQLWRQTGAEILLNAQKLERLYPKLLKLNKKLVAQRNTTMFQQRIKQMDTAHKLLTSEQKAIKKIDREGRKILEHEFGKKMRYKSIRQLNDGPAAALLKDLKPVWLMSPLSVSDTLALTPDAFDLVIFDEASQITLEEGIPALFRSKQAVIVGDEMQMPPTNFFNTKVDADQYDDQVNQYPLSEIDSLLDQGARKLPSIMLGWHYRSKHEALIGFSNHAFYHQSLLTIPDTIDAHQPAPKIIVEQPIDGTKNWMHLFNRSISFHHTQPAVYKQRSNLFEADYIAHLVAHHLKSSRNETVGVVAFSQEQQYKIEQALEVLAAQDVELSQLLEAAYQREDDDQFVGLFIKNLENVQGDERDMIIISICYGPNEYGKMYMNFGPINRSGGEKRLNVIFSRAKQHMAVVSTIQHHQITNDYNDGARYLQQFLRYAESVSESNTTVKEQVLNRLTIAQDHEAVEHPALAEQIKNRLQKHGLDCDLGVGDSTFKVAVAVKGISKYQLGILIDNDWHYQSDNVFERYVQQPQLLQNFGWQIMQVWSKDWYNDEDAVMAQILKKLGQYAT